MGGTTGLLTTGTTIVFNVDINDARYLTKDFQGLVKPETLATFEIGEAVARIGTSIVKLRTRDRIPADNPDRRKFIIESSHRGYYKTAGQVKEELNMKGVTRYGLPPATDDTLSPDNSDEFEYDEFD